MQLAARMRRAKASVPQLRPQLRLPKNMPMQEYGRQQQRGQREVKQQQQLEVEPHAIAITSMMSLTMKSDSGLKERPRETICEDRALAASTASLERALPQPACNRCDC